MAIKATNACARTSCTIFGAANPKTIVPTASDKGVGQDLATIAKDEKIRLPTTVYAKNSTCANDHYYYPITRPNLYSCHFLITKLVAITSLQATTRSFAIVVKLVEEDSPQYTVTNFSRSLPLL